MGKETAETFQHRRSEWLKQKKILDAQEPQLPSLRLDDNTVVILDLIDNEVEGISLIHDHDEPIHLETRSAIVLASFIFELFGDKYSPV